MKKLPKSIVECPVCGKPAYDYRLVNKLVKSVIVCIDMHYTWEKNKWLK